MGIIIILSISATWLLVSLALLRLTHSKINIIGGGFLATVMLWSFIAWLNIDTVPPVKPLPTAENKVKAKDTLPEQRLTPVYHSGEPIEIVKRQPCHRGGTIGSCFMEKARILAVTDLGWSMRDADDGFVVEKRIQIEGLRSSTIYRWHVSSFGDVRAVNGHAIGIGAR